MLNEEHYKIRAGSFFPLVCLVRNLEQKASQPTGDIYIFFKLIHMQIFLWIFARWRG